MFFDFEGIFLKKELKELASKINLIFVSSVEGQKMIQMH